MLRNSLSKNIKPCLVMPEAWLISDRFGMGLINSAKHLVAFFRWVARLKDFIEHYIN